jgi:two-component sensor histidine kinase
VQHIASPLIPVAESFITDELFARPLAAPDYLKEKLALQDLARHMAEQPADVLPRLVQLAMDICEGSSAGTSILEPQTGEFRWPSLKGILSTFEGAKTPRNNSPCGLCLDVQGPLLMDRPERAYDWIRDAAITVPEVLLVPLSIKGLEAMGTIWAVSDKPGHFNSDHARALGELSTFAAMALRSLQTEEHLKQSLHEQEVLTREMSHRVKNLFSLTASMIRMSRVGARSADDLAEKLVGRIEALAEANALVRRQFSDTNEGGVPFGEIVSRILRPYGHAKSTVDGPNVAIGERSTNSIALIFHELATNSAKYGSLTSDQGLIAVSWTADEKDIRVAWREAGGPVTRVPDDTGFGTRLIQATVSGTGGEIEYQWADEGLCAHLRLPLASLKN